MALILEKTLTISKNDNNDEVVTTTTTAEKPKPNIKIKVYPNAGIHILQNSNLVIFQNSKRHTTEYVTAASPKSYKFNNKSNQV